MCPGPHQDQGWGWRRETGISPPVKYFTDRSKAVLLLWIFYVFVLSCVCYAFVSVCLYVLCGHLLGKGWPLGSRLWCLTVSLSLPHWYPGSGVVLDCIDSWSLHPNLLWEELCFSIPLYKFIFNEWSLAWRPSCFPKMNRVPERHIDLASGTCIIIIALCHSKSWRETLRSYVEYFTNYTYVKKKRLI